MGTKLAVVALVAALTPTRAGSALAQSGLAVPDPPLVVLAKRDLRFGTVFPGVPSSVATNNPRLAGEFQVQGAAGLTVRVELLLPSALSSPGGATLPITFVAGDGSHDFPHGLPHRTLFDPHAPVVAALGPNGKLNVWLGGTVMPALLQTGGAYAAAISITIFNLGI
ncbi:MAG TPA: hypothetical protein VF970_16265 [Gemmatimonadales bacterium]